MRCRRDSEADLLLPLLPSDGHNGLLLTDSLRIAEVGKELDMQGHGIPVTLASTTYMGMNVLHAVEPWCILSLSMLSHLPASLPRYNHSYISRDRYCCSWMISYVILQRGIVWTLECSSYLFIFC